MINRIQLLKNLVSLEGDLFQIEKKLKSYQWDHGSPLITLTRIEFKSILEKYINKNINNDTLYNWANLIECRDDIDFEDEVIKEMIFEIANAEINELITMVTVETMIAKLLPNHG